MVGALDSSLGVAYGSIIPRWHDNHQTKNVLISSGPKQFNALKVSVDTAGLAMAAEHIQVYL
jgi:calcineurin-like phosphoesterase